MRNFRGLLVKVKMNYEVSVVTFQNFRGKQKFFLDFWKNMAIIDYKFATTRGVLKCS